MYIAIQKGKYTVLGSLGDLNEHINRYDGKHLVLHVIYGDKALSRAINMMNKSIEDKDKYFHLSTLYFQSAAVFSEHSTSPIHICDTWHYGYALDLAAINSDAMTYEDIYGKELTSD